MPHMQGDTSGPPCVGRQCPHSISRLTDRLQHRLNPCRHLFCITCITKAFREQGEQVVWHTCPQCACTVTITPPLAERGVAPIAAWLRAASKASMPSVDELVMLERELADVCSWDSNRYLLSSGTGAVAKGPACGEEVKDGTWGVDEDTGVGPP